MSKKDVLTIPTEGDEVIQNWHAHLFYLNRRKHFILTHSASLFSIVVFDVIWREPDESELAEFQRRLNKTPMSMLGMKYPIERFRECVFQTR